MMKPKKAAELFIRRQITEFKINQKTKVKIEDWYWNTDLFLPDGTITINPKLPLLVDLFLCYINVHYVFYFDSFYTESFDSYPSQKKCMATTNDYIDNSNLEAQFEDWFYLINEKMRRSINKEELFKKIKRAIKRINDTVVKAINWIEDFIKEVENYNRREDAKHSNKTE